jgi:glycosyltransferase involved in cell wall biosynthesis
MAAGYGLPAGIEAHILHYATELRNHGFDTGVVVFKPLPAAKHRFLEALESRGIPIASLQADGAARARNRIRALKPIWIAYTALVKRRKPNLTSFTLWSEGRAGVRELERRLAEERPDVIHVFGRLRTDAWDKLPAARTIHHEMMTGTVDRHWTEAELNDFRAYAERVARYFAPGTGVAENVHREFGIRREIVPIFTMCPDEANAERGTRNAGTPLRFGVICRLTGQKGIFYLLEALKQYRDRHGDVDFTFGGIGPLENEIQAFARQHALAKVRVVRVVSPAELLGGLDVFVHPSVDDAMPMSIAEALMCGVPCVVCRVGGCADLVRDGQEGFVIEPRRTDLILASMERFAGMGVEEFTAFRRRARQRYEDVCRPDRVGTFVAGIYRSVLRERG